MTAEVQPWEEPAAPVVHLASAPPGPAPAAADIDSWVEIASAYTRLANQIANTDFPPAEMRGKPEALVATFLMGREMNLGPMTALMNLHVIKGKVGQSAHLMRAMILARGHEIEYDEATDSQCVCRGRRRGEQSWTYVTFTSQQARTAGIDLGKYPADKLVARATARVARRKFADVIAGMEYASEELAAGDYVFGDDAQAAALEAGTTEVADEAPKAARTVRRPATRARSTRSGSTSSPPAPPPQRSAPERAPSGPPLPGEEQAAADEQEAADHEHAVESRSAPEDKPAPQQTKFATRAQLGKLGALFTEAKVSDRAARLRVVQAITGHSDLSSSTQLSQDDASQLIDDLMSMGADDIAAIADPANQPQQGQLGDGQDDEPVDAEVVDDGKQDEGTPQ